jgi:hypothetical protein
MGILRSYFPLFLLDRVCIGITEVGSRRGTVRSGHRLALAGSVSSQLRHFSGISR